MFHIRKPRLNLTFNKRWRTQQYLDSLIKLLPAVRHISTSRCRCRTIVKDIEQSTISFDNILSDENRERVTERISVPVLATPRVASRGCESTGNAAVLISLCTVNHEPSLLFTLRSSKLVQHRGEVSFPGGKMDPTDITLINTAVREAEEELGIDKSNIDVWGQMNPGIPPRGAPHRPMVFGVIANLGEIDVNKLDVCKSEVEFVFTRTIRSLCDPRNYGYTKFTRGFTRSAVDYAMPVFTGLDRDRSPKIWGITAIFVHYTLKLLAPNLYRGPFVKVNE